MKIDKRLNLIVPVVQGDGRKLWVHSTPLSTEVFNQHFEIIALTFSAIHGQGYGAMAGPRIAAKLMRKIAEAEKVWDGPMGVEAAVMNEIRRLTMVVVPQGFRPAEPAVENEDPSKRRRALPDRAERWDANVLLPDAVKRGLLDENDQDILENALVFFTVVSAMHRPDVLRVLLESFCGMWGAQTSSLNSTAYAASLPTLSETENTGGMAAT